MNMPKTPFSTRLSGSAKETELRLRSIFQWKKKRPPVMLVVLTAVVVLLCFGLFSCVPQEKPPADDPIVETTPKTEEPEPTQTEEQPAENLPTLTVAVEDLLNTMQQIEEKEDYPAQIYQVEVTGLSLPVTLTMHLDLVAELEAHGQRVILTNPLDIYGNCNFDLFEADGAVILEGGYYWIGDVYILSPEGSSEMHPGEEASYYLYRDDQGNLKYRLTNNKIADITQIGALSAVTQYGELLSAHGDASIVNGEAVFAEPERQKFAEYERLWQEFEQGWWSEHYHSVEEILEINRAKKEGREPSPIYSTEYRDQLICDYYTRTYQRDVYMANEMPEQVQQGNERIDEIVVLGETRVYEVTGQLLEIYKSRYDGSSWNRYSSHLVITKGIDNAYEQIIGTAYIREGQTAEKVILEKVHGLSDLEVSLWREGYPWPVGPGSQIHIYREAYEGPETVEVLEGWEPIYQEGDYWAVHRWSGVDALCYHRLADAQTGYYDIEVNTFDTTRTDLRTYRGIRVGDSRAKVMETYPELKSGDYWGKYPGEDYLWYCTSELDFGAALIFFFEDDTVSRIVLNDMFN